MVPVTIAVDVVSDAGGTTTDDNDGKVGWFKVQLLLLLLFRLFETATTTGFTEPRYLLLVINGTLCPAATETFTWKCARTFR